MTEVPIIASKYPKRLKLENVKVYIWCRGGRAESQPSCDGPNAGTGINTVKFTAMAGGARTLCQCRSSVNAPICDGGYLPGKKVRDNIAVLARARRPEHQKRLNVPAGAERLARYFGASIGLMQVFARACKHAGQNNFSPRDITSWQREISDQGSIRYAGVS